MRRTAPIALVTALLVVALAGCGGDGSGGHGSGGSDAESEPIPVPSAAPGVPDEDELAERGFDCRTLPPGDTGMEEGDDMSWLDGQSHRVCLLSDGVIAASWDMVVLDDRVVAWDYLSFPLEDEDDLDAVTESTSTALETVHDALLPDDADVFGPALAEWTTPESTDTWDFEGTGHVAVGGRGLVDFDAALVDTPSALSVSTQPTTAEPELDADAFMDAAGDAGMDCTLDEREWPWGDDVQCERDDVTVMMTVGEQGAVTNFSITTFGSGDAGVLDALADAAGRAGSEQFSEFVADVTEAADADGRALVWASGMPAIVHPASDPDGLQVDAGVLLELPE